MEINKTEKKGEYIVKSSKSNRFYNVDINKPFCNCPQFLYREIKQKGECKHIKAARELFLSENKISAVKIEEIKSKVSEKKGINTIDAMELYGEDAIEKLLEESILYEKAGKVFVFK